MSAMNARPVPVRRWTGALVTTLVVALLPATPALAIAGGEPVTGDTWTFAAKIDVGSPEDDGRSCTGALVARQWVLTAKTCFTEGGTPPVAGPPQRSTSVTVGRPDLTGTTGHRVAVAALVPHPGRDLVLAKLASRITDIAPVPLASAAATTGETVLVAGYGRTSTQWMPDRLHAAAFTVGAITDTGMGIAGATADAAVCRGDAGGPTIRRTGGRVELIGVHSTSWQGGCYGNGTETRTGAGETRVDNLGAWFTDTTRELPQTDFNGDGRTDIAGLDANWDMSLYTGNDVGKLTGAGLMWPGGGQWRDFHAITAGDFNGDGRTDIAGLDANWDMSLYTGNGAGKLTRCGSDVARRGSVAQFPRHHRW